MKRNIISHVLKLAMILVVMSATFISLSLPASAATAAWSIVSSPNNGTTQANYLQGVSCVSASDCWAVGYYFNGTVNQTLIEQWNGTSWSIVTSPTTADSDLQGVSCVSSTDCWAVGYDDVARYQTLIEQWNGTSWSIVTSPNTATTQDNDLYGVSCVSASDCWAVGYYNDGYAVQTLIEQWGGTSWSIVTSPTPNVTLASELQGVSCVSSTDCTAVGYYYTATYNQTLIEQWNGTSWAIVTSPNTATTQNNFLQGVSCVSASDCWAVGYYYNGGYNQTLIEQWNGTSWSIVTSPTSAVIPDYLQGVSCVSASDCWAVGYVGNVSQYQTLIEQWNGTSWSIVTSPNTGSTQPNVLWGVSCASSSECWAVGYYNGIGYNQTLIEQMISGTLGFATTPANVTFTSLTLNGSTQTSPATQTLDIGDATGSGNGWNVTLSNTTFTAGANTLANGDFVATVPATDACDTTCTPATLTSTFSSLVGTGGAKLMSAAAGTGMGNQTVTIPWLATIPGSSYAGTYTSTWTLTVVSGP